MSYEAIVYNVMIASSSDVEEERNMIREVIIKWNYTHSFHNRKVLIPLGWETHSAPLLTKEGDGAQAVINEMVLKPADLLVAIFKDRIGTPTASGKSGTIEEIERHLSLGKQVLLYFGEQTVVSGEQIEDVKSYKEECKKKGMIHEYNDISVLRENFTDHLQLVANIFEGLEPKPVSTVGHTLGVSGESLAVIEERIPVVDERTKILLKDMAQDPKGKIVVSKLIGEDLKIETNNGKYFGYEQVLAMLERSRWIRKEDNEGRVYSLTDLGHQEAAKLKLI